MAERQIGNYKILKQIGAGGMAKVYLAVHKDVPNLKVVLKVLSSPQHAARFMQEADKLALLERNPNICHIRHFFNHEDELVIAMEYIDGKSLEEMIAERGSFPVNETIKITADLLTALAFAHDKEIYHRDIKPGNVMFDRDGQLKIIDFGIAKGKTDPQLTIVGTATGTPEYMAPEQFAGGEQIDYAKCDIYAVGTMMYAMLTGRPPFKAENEFILRDMKLSEEPAPPSSLNGEIPKELDRIILKAIDKDPAKRFASVAEMRSEIMKLSGKPGRSEKTGLEETVPAIPIEPAPGRAPAAKRGAAAGRRRAGSRGGRGKIVGAIAVVVVIAAAAVFGIRMLAGGGEAERPATGDAREGLTSIADTQKIVASAAPDSAVRREPEEKKPGIESTAEKTEPEEKRDVAATKPIRPAERSGTLRVGSIPVGAEIYINNKRYYGDTFLGETPRDITLPPGAYDLKLIKIVDGKPLTYTEKIIVKDGEITFVRGRFIE